MYPKFKEISLDTATWTVAFLGAIEERETKSKKPFCTFHLLDGAIAIIANLWNTEKKDIYKVQEKSVISVQLYKKLYNGVETYEVKEYQAAPDDAKLEDYLLTAPIPSQDMMDEIKSILSKEISETELYPLVMEILDENADKLLYWAAAKTIHHNCYGGLLYHMLRMLKTAVILSRVYRFDKELLYSAVILHDIGKLQELDTDATGVAEYTVDGNLFGHTLLAIEMIDRKNFENPTYPAEKIRLLKHCIAAHHGQLEYMQCKTPYSRAIFYEQSQESFQKAFLPENLVSSTGRLSVIESGRARSTGDFIVGMNLTVACTLKYPNNGVLSIGRVQTAVLNMIVQRENEIHNFKPTPYFVLQGKFATQKGIQYIGTHVSQKIPNAQEAHKLLSKLQNGSHVGVIFNLNTEQIKKKKPYLYDLSTLQMDANKKYGFSLSKTLSLAQKLYENGYITYPRTDSVYLPDDMGEEMQRTIDHLMSLTVYSEYNTGRRVDPLDRHYFDSHKVSSHYAIVPTPKAGMPTGDEGKLYDLIARSVICMLFPDAVFNKTKFQTVVENEVFETTGMTLVSAGFLAVLGVPKDKIIPNVKNGESVTADFEALKKETEPPKRYTDATLLNAMINCGKTLEDEELRRLMAGKPGERPLGLGRPSSQASIVQTLEDRQYIEKKGKTIIPTTKGINLIACFPVQELKSAVMTAQWEKRLDDIENGMDSYESFLSDLQASVRNWTNQVITAPINPILGAGKEGKMTDYTCPICGKKMEEYLNMYGCSGHKEKTCDFKVPKKVCGVTLKAADLDSLFKNGQTQTIKGFVSKEKKKFNARLIVDRESGKVKFYFPPAEETELTCPFCNKSLKKYDWGYACPDRSGCGFHLGTNVCKHELTEDEVRQILVDGRTANYISFVSKKGNKFRAAIVLDRDSKQTKFETEEW